jgi:hypothetical protein
MDYDKKRKRQTGRQARNGHIGYKIYTDEYLDGLHAEIEQLIHDGVLPRVSFDVATFYRSSDNQEAPSSA